MLPWVRERPFAPMHRFGVHNMFVIAPAQPGQCVHGRVLSGKLCVEIIS